MLLCHSCRNRSKDWPASIVLGFRTRPFALVLTVRLMRGRLPSREAFNNFLKITNPSSNEHANNPFETLRTQQRLRRGALLRMFVLLSQAHAHPRSPCWSGWSHSSHSQHRLFGLRPAKGRGAGRLGGSEDQVSTINRSVGRKAAIPRITWPRIAWQDIN